ncbi:hypothetical protein BKA66DRAFT_405744 [Pyrenochaeta sp. MPI-SDFR-AT-0127]|nr:hypothetical protein BKA66DRAFT_405744 [Pyrenochaeta sp. MPI-SDFR-AT-0127]
MKFTVATVAAASMALVSASPCGTNPDNTKINDGDVFRVMTIRSGSDIQYGSVQAANNGLLVNTPKQNASCSEDVNYASFRLSSGALFLNTDNPPQQIFVDRSGMGQGVIQYTTGVQSPSRNSERVTFAIDENSNLVFNGGNGPNLGFVACPGALSGGYSVWLSGAENPGGNQGCVGFVARALKESNPVTCSYTAS